MSFLDTEQADNAQAPASEATAVAPAASQAAPDDNAQDDPTSATQDAELEAEIAELDEAEDEIDGVKIKGKKEAVERHKAERLMHADYTRKTQTGADERRSLESDRAQHHQQVQVHQALSKEIAQITSVDQRLQQLQTVNLQALSAQDPIQAQNLLIELSQLQAHRGQLLGSLTQKQQQLQSLQQQEIAKRADDARTFLMREFKDWSPEKDRALEAYAAREGLDTRALGQFLVQNPKIARVLDKAAKWDNSLKQRAAAKAKPEPPPKPVTRVGGAAASNTKSPSDMSPAEYRVWRQERNQKR